MSSKIYYLKQEAIDRAKWDSCISQSVNGLVYGASWYLDTVCRNWDALVLGDYDAVFPLPYNSKYGLYYSLQPLFTQQLGLFAKSEEYLPLLPQFLSAIPKKFLLVILNLNSHNTSIGEAKPRVNFIVDLNQEYEAIRKNYSDTCRKRVRKSQVAGTTLKTGISTDQIIEVYKLNLENRKVLQPEQFRLMHRLLNNAAANNCLETVGVFDEEGQLCATAGFIKDHRRLYYVCGGASNSGRNCFANLRIIDHVLAAYAGKKMIFDFEGSEIPPIASFFRHFGPQETKYFVYERNLLLWPLTKFLRK